ncbi:MAG TPA: hypothetical protein VFN42_14090 [Acetobacteraceae bacterium]|nr:hypothetical protein [Acetobacteraceae bacterium]
MRLPPAVIVHGLADACTVLAAGAPVTLLSAPGAAEYAGCSWWQALLAQAGKNCPGASFTDLLDCGEASGYALAALRIGLVRLVLRPGAPGWNGVAAIAARQGGMLLDAPPPALDMAERRARRRLHDWLHARTTPGDSGPALS